MGHKERANIRNSNNGRNSGGSKKLSKKAKQREERARQHRQKSVSLDLDEVPLSDSEAKRRNQQPIAEKRRTDNDTMEQQQQQQRHPKRSTTATTSAATTSECGPTIREPIMREPQGLSNLGNTCFFNSTMQCLLTNLPFLNHYFDVVQSMPNQFLRIRSAFSARVNDTEIKVPKMEVHLPRDFPMPTFWVFSKFVNNFHKDDTKRSSPAALFDQISKKVPRFRSMAQQDAHELLHYLMDMLRQEEISRFKHALSTAQYDDEHDDTDVQQNGVDGERPSSNNNEIANQPKQVVKGGGVRNSTNSTTSRQSNSSKTATPIISRREQRRRLICRALLDGPARPVLDTVYGGVLQQSIKCDRCAHVSVALEPFFDLSLPVKAVSSSGTNRRGDIGPYGSSAATLEDALRLFTADELLRGDTHAYRCENCTKPKKPPPTQKQQQNNTDQQTKALPQPLPANAVKSYKVLSPPLVLTLHLNRFEQVGRHFHKYNGYVQFPLVLNLAPFCSSNLKCLRPDQNRRLLLYRLCGVVSHSGGMGGGHYIAFVARYPPRSEADGSHCLPVDRLFELSHRCCSSTFTSSSTHNQPNGIAEQLADQLSGTVALLENNNSSSNTPKQQQPPVNCNDNAEEDDDGQFVSSNGATKTNDTQMQEIEMQALAAAKHLSKWFYCSDSYVRSVRLDEVLNAQAFLLFYERIY